MKASLDLPNNGLRLSGQLLRLDSTSNSQSLTLCCTPFSTSTSNFPTPTADASSSFIPFKHILWVEETNSGNPNEIELTFTKLTDNATKLNPSTQIMTIELPNQPEPIGEGKLTTLLMSYAYSSSKPERSIMVLVNPNSGKGEALKIYQNDVEPILKSARCKLNVVKTEYQGHAIDIARELDIDRYDIIVCASGDGIPHEVINGLYARDDKVEAFNKLCVCQTPGGSGNAMSLSCLGTLSASVATVRILKGSVVRCDLMAVSLWGSNSVLVSFLSQTYGIIAQADIGTEWMRFIGQQRFELGVTMQVFSRKTYPCSIGVRYVCKNKDQLADYYKENFGKVPKSHSERMNENSFNLKYVDQFNNAKDPMDFDNDNNWEIMDPNITDNLGIFYSGKMPYISKDTNFFPAALPNDGTIDVVVTNGKSNIISTADALLSLDKGLHVWKDDVEHIKVEAFRLIPRKKGFISIDGENTPYKPFQVEVLKGVMKTIMCEGQFTETNFLDKI